MAYIVVLCFAKKLGKVRENEKVGVGESGETEISCIAQLNY